MNNGIDGKQNLVFQLCEGTLKTLLSLNAITKIREGVGKVIARISDAFTPVQPAMVYA